MALTPKSSPSPDGTPTFVFRLVNFDKDGNKLGKRKYGYSAKTGFGSDLDETVYQGIISRAEQAFALRPKQYSVYLILSGKRTKELGESDIYAGSPFRIADFEAFKTYRNLMAAVQLDPKNRKVVNLCVVPLDFEFKKTQTVPLAIDGKVGAAAAVAPRVEPAANSSAAKSPSSPPLNRDHVSSTVENGKRQSQAQAKAWAEDQAMLRSMQGVDTRPKYAQAAAPVKQPEMPGAMPGMRAAPVQVKQEPTVNPQDTILKPTAVPATAGAKLPTLPAPHTQPVFGFPGFAPYAPQPATQPGTSKPPTWFMSPEVLAAQQAQLQAMRQAQAQAKAMKATVPVPSWPDWTRAAAAATPAQPKHASPFAAAAPAPKPAAASASKPVATAAPKTTEIAAAAPTGTATNVHPCAYTQPSQGAQSFYTQATANKGTPSFSGWGTKPVQPKPTQASAEPPRRACRAFSREKFVVESATAPKPAVAEQKKAFQGLVPLIEKFVNDFNKTMAEEAGELPPIKLAVENKTPPASSPVLTAQGEKQPVFPNSQEKKAEEAKKAEVEVKHKATCDICSKWIVGIRYKCLDCPDWDCCEGCFKKADRAHPDHSFVIVRKQGDIVWRSDLISGSKTTQHYGVHCDSCNKPIFDIRYKCTHASCPDFDLCADCEADPTSYATGRKIGAHDYSTHHMLKIRKPVSRFTDGRMARDVLQQALKTAQAMFGQAAQASPQPKAAAEPKAGLHITPGSNDKTLIVDVDVPYSMLNGKKEISIALDLGKNEKGETVILGPSSSAQASSTVEEVKSKVEDDVKPVKHEDGTADATVKTEEAVEAAKPAEEIKPVEAKIEKDVLNATWVEDVTFDDGTAVAPGAVFNKIWKIKNTGSAAWPAGCQLIRVGGSGKSDDQDASFDLPEVAAGESVNIIAKNVIAPDMPGKFMVYYRFIGPDGTTRFGDRLWLDVNVEEEEGSLAKSRNASEHSLHSSSIVAPTLSVKNPTEYEDISAFTSPRTAPSELPESEGFTAGEEDEDDDFVLLSDGEDNFAEIDSVSSSKN